MITLSSSGASACQLTSVLLMIPALLASHRACAHLSLAISRPAPPFWFLFLLVQLRIKTINYLPGAHVDKGLLAQALCWTQFFYYS